jgi:predicted nucleic-acid-binding protein
VKTALDTNILVRFLVNDDEEQARRAYKLFAEAESGKETLFVPQVVVLEMIWVLDSVYEVPRQEILDSVDALLRMPVLEFESQPAIQGFVNAAREMKIDLSDVPIAVSARHAGCDRVLTFDKRASKQGIFERLQS